jgi:hypothetical protein
MIAIGAATAGTWMIEARRDEPTCAPSVNQKSPIDLSEFPRPVLDPEDAYVYECPVAFANGALQASIRFAGNEAPDPDRFAAYAGVVATKPNASAIDATFASFETLMYFPLLVWMFLQGARYANRVTSTVV